jgi:metallophosphoesterase superfamily enzyme
MKVKIYGYSDDLIEMEGDLRDEYDSYHKPGYLTFSNGTIVVTPAFIMACEINDILNDILDRYVRDADPAEQDKWLNKLTNYLEGRGVK